MEIFFTYSKVFLVGGFICLIGQILINRTKLTSARILVFFLLAGVVLEAFGIFKYIEDFAGSGATVPIVGFGSAIAKGAIKGAYEGGVLGALAGGLKAVSAGLSAAIAFGFIATVCFGRSHSKNLK